MTKEVKPFDYSELDVGIRETCKWLHEHGWKTLGSSDGTGGMFDYAYVEIAAAPSDLIHRADALRYFIESRCDLKIVSEGEEGVTIDVFYDAANCSGWITLSEFDDALLAKTLRKVDTKELDNSKSSP